VVTDIPFRIDHLGWSRWHWLLVIGLGITWMLDGLDTRRIPLEVVRWPVALGATFGVEAFEDALAGFRRMYNVAPARVLCAPDVLRRFAVLFARGADDADRRTLRYEGLQLGAAVLAPGTIVFEGEVDDVKMGDW
jgi:hypothetical protein